MNVIPETFLRKLTIRNNAIVIPKKIDELKDRSNEYKQLFEMRLLSFVHDGTITRAVCELLNDLPYDHNFNIAQENREKGSIISLPISILKFVKEPEVS